MHWNDANKELPEEMKQVLVYCQSLNGDLAIGFRLNNHWYCEYGCYEQGIVTHWLQFPYPEEEFHLSVNIAI